MVSNCSRQKLKRSGWSKVNTKDGAIILDRRLNSWKSLTLSESLTKKSNAQSASTTFTMKVGYYIRRWPLGYTELQMTKTNSFASSVCNTTAETVWFKEIKTWMKLIKTLSIRDAIVTIYPHQIATASWAFLRTKNCQSKKEIRRMTILPVRMNPPITTWATCWNIRTQMAKMYMTFWKKMNITFNASSLTNSSRAISS